MKKQKIFTLSERWLTCGFFLVGLLGVTLYLYALSQPKPSLVFENIDYSYCKAYWDKGLKCSYKRLTN